MPRCAGSSVNEVVGRIRPFMSKSFAFFSSHLELEPELPFVVNRAASPAWAVGVGRRLGPVAMIPRLYPSLSPVGIAGAATLHFGFPGLRDGHAGRQVFVRGAAHGAPIVPNTFLLGQMRKGPRSRTAASCYPNAAPSLSPRSAGRIRRELPRVRLGATPATMRG